jgi:transposase, IS5 family
MRVVHNNQMYLGEVDISKIQFDPKSRDDIPKILKGLHYIYTTPEIREAIFAILEQEIAPKTDKKNGRPGMDLWNILVMGVLRLGLNCDYDRLHYLVNGDRTIRRMLGHADDFFEELFQYNLQTVKDNVRLLTPELLDKINQVVVKAGHGLLKKKDEPLKARADSFVVETDVEFPTDVRLLFDSVRKVIELIAFACGVLGISRWRQSDYNIKQVKRSARWISSKKRSGAQSEEKKAKQDKAIKDGYQDYLDLCRSFLQKASQTMESILSAKEYKDMIDIIVIQNTLSDIEYYMGHADRQINQITRRVFQGEVIPHEEKVFSIFEPHTEWICKGKAGILCELGVRVSVVEDDYGFLLHHCVMEKKTDDKIAVLLIEETKERFPNLRSCSFDKSFHTKENQIELMKYLEVVGLPRKGKLSRESKEIESSEGFKEARYKHSAIESAINGLEVHGLDRCPDEKIEGFKRYVSLAIVGYNIHHLGTIITKRERKKAERNKKKRIREAERIPLAA